MWTNSGRRLRGFDRPDLTILFPIKKNRRFLDIFALPGPGPGHPGPGRAGDPKIQKSKNPKIRDFGPKSMKFGFDRLCQGPKINFLPFGTSKNPQNPENPRKKPENPENPDFWSLVPHSYPLRGVYGTISIFQPTISYLGVDYVATTMPDSEILTENPIIENPTSHRKSYLQNFIPVHNSTSV